MEKNFMRTNMNLISSDYTSVHIYLYFKTIELKKME